MHTLHLKSNQWIWRPTVTALLSVWWWTWVPTEISEAARFHPSTLHCSSQNINGQPDVHVKTSPMQCNLDYAHANTGRTQLTQGHCNILKKTHRCGIGSNSADFVGILLYITLCACALCKVKASNTVDHSIYNLQRPQEKKSLFAEK